jgi:alpha-tubulin suppressor-like RCC1 family protein
MHRVVTFLMLMVVLMSSTLTTDTVSAAQSRSTDPWGSFTQISVGDNSCALNSSGIAYCWGDNIYGALGNGTTTPTHIPTAVTMPAGVTFSSIDVANGRYACALSSTGMAYCWGENTYGQLGNGTTTNSNIPSLVTMPASTTFTAISVNNHHSCALTNTSTAYCWGLNTHGQLGNGTTINSNIPSLVTMPASTTFTKITTGGHDGRYFSCALSASNNAYCWGNNLRGYLGNGTTVDSTIPTAVTMPASTTFTAIDAGSDMVCTLSSTQVAYCWGSGDLGNGVASLSTTPVAVTMPSGVTFTAIETGSMHTCALSTSNNSYCWGSNLFGQLGNNTIDDSLVPIPTSMPVSVTFASMSIGVAHNCALTSAGVAYCWGYNMMMSYVDGVQQRGKLGICSMVDRKIIPTQVGTGCSSSATSTPTTGPGGKPGAFNISTPPNNATNQPTTITLEWGASTSATRYDYCLETSPESCPEWVNVGTNNQVTIENLQPDTAYFWKVRATNGSGTTVANNNTFQKFTTGKRSVTSTIRPSNTMTPTPHPFAFKDVAVGASFTLAVLQNGTLVTWGFNRDGQASLPRWMATKPVNQVETGSNYAIALGTDGRVYGWGANDFGQLTLPSSVLSGVRSISAGLGHVMAVKTNGDVVAWGRNDFKQIDIPLAARRNVTAVSAGHSHSLAIKDGKVIGWGRNTWSQVNIPKNVTDIIAVSAGFDHSLALKRDGTVFCWGRKNENQCKLPNGLTDVIAISAGIGYSMALTRDGVVFAWGRNNLGQAKVPNGITKAGAISAGYVNSVVGLRDASVVAFGDASLGALVSRTPTVTP